MLWELKEWQKQPNKNWGWLLWLEQLSDPMAEAWRRGSVCARTWFQENLVGPFLASVREIQMTVALVLAAKGIGWKQEILEALDMLFLFKRVSVTAFKLPGSLWHLEAMAVKGALGTGLHCFFSGLSQDSEQHRQGWKGDCRCLS